MHIIIIAALLIASICAFALLAGIPTWFLWNWLMPAIFGLPEISFLQAFGLLILFGFLFKPSGASVKTK